MKNSKIEKESTSFIAGLVAMCMLIFIIGLGTGMESVNCVCSTDKIPAGKSTSSQGKIKYTTIYLERATTYQATIAQCDSTPFSTASGAKINPDYYQKWCAISRDLHERWGGPLSFGDTLMVHSCEHPNFNGKWVVQDLMGPGYEKSIDFLLEQSKNHPKLGIGTDFKISFQKK